jgi:hypothetical protein
VLAWRAHPAWLAWGVLAFIGVALLHLKVLLVLAVLVPPAIAAAWWWLRAASRRGEPR